MSSTVRELLTISMQLNGALAVGETPSSEDLADGLKMFKRMMDNWSTQNLSIYAKVREVFSLVGGQASYTFGVGGNFNSSRPQLIENAGIIMATSPDAELPVEIIDQDQFAAITDKSTQSTYPWRLYPVYTFPQATLTFWPIPGDAAQVVLYSWKPFSEITSLNAVIDFPPGYELAITHNHAVLMAPLFNRAVSADVKEVAKTSFADIKRMNAKPPLLGIDPALQQRWRPYNIYTGNYK